MAEIHVFTSAAFNYIPKVRLLFQSLRKYHPEWRLHLALADELRPNIDLSAEPFDEIVSAAELGIPSFRGWTFCHSIVEFATAIKPFMLARLLKEPGCKKVLYFDPDTVAFSPLNDILDALNESNILLTPHQTTPETTIEAVMDNEICSLKHGVYNLGFVAVSATEVAMTFANWWSRRVYNFCRADIPNGLFTDQRWIDLAPAFFSGVAIMRSSRHNVASWNLTTRHFSQSSTGQYLVDEQPLGFYHFTGFDSGAHRVMALKNAGNNGAVKKLISWYETQTESLAHDPLAREAWAYGTFSDGTVITRAQRVVYRDRTDLQAAFPEPFDAGTYLAWWNSQGKVEYPELFNKQTAEEALAKFTSVLRPGFRGGSDGFDWDRVFAIIGKSVTQPRSGLEFGKRGWEILKNEGVTGLMRRLQTY